MRVLQIAVSCWLSFTTLAACSSGDTSNMMNVDENLTTADYNEPLTTDSSPAPVPAPSHLYAIKDGDKYGYVAAVSEDDQKRGKVAGDVTFFVYRGKVGDTYKIDLVTPDGQIVEDDECQRPCTAIKRYTYGGISYLGFTPDSLIGAAYTDAFNGFLVPASRPQPHAYSTEPATYPQVNAAETTASPEQSNETDWSPPSTDPVVTNDG
jgi:hypothetical protein